MINLTSGVRNISTGYIQQKRYSSEPTHFTSEGFFDSLFLSNRHAEALKNQGNEHYKKGEYSQAIDVYKKATELNPDYADVYFNLGRSYKQINDIPNAIIAYETLIRLTPEDTEAYVNLGDCYKAKGDFQKAKVQYKSALNCDEKFDLAKRRLRQAENEELARVNPRQAEIEKQQQMLNNMAEAKKLAFNYFSPRFLEDMIDIKFEFGKTGRLGGDSNIAQYENNRRRILVTDEYTWASPEVVSAYLVHELIHAKDKDSLSSITEEQDAYRESVKFWLLSNHGIKDPEMDFAARLYKDSRSSLDSKVAEIYSSKDSSMPLYSPNHGINAQKIDSLVAKAKGLFGRILNMEQPVRDTSIVS